MCGYKISVILIFHIILITNAYESNENLTKYDGIDLTTANNLSPNLGLTVETETKTSKTMSDASGQDGLITEGRTFAVKRLQLMLLPLMYKIGVMTTLLAVLVIVSLKSLMIGIILLVIKVASFFAKFHHPEPQHQTSWSSPPVQPWLQPQPQPIHLHISNSGNGHYDHQIQDQVYSGWEHTPPSGPYYGSPVTMNHGQYYLKG